MTSKHAYIIIFWITCPHIDNILFSKHINHISHITNQPPNHILVPTTLRQEDSTNISEPKLPRSVVDD